MSLTLSNTMWYPNLMSGCQLAVKIKIMKNISASDVFYHLQLLHIGFQLDSHSVAAQTSRECSHWKSCSDNGHRGLSWFNLCRCSLKRNIF